MHSNKLDLLFVIDNGCGMKEEQANLAANSERFLANLLDSDVDFQIGIITPAVDPNGRHENSSDGALQTLDGDPSHKIIRSSWPHEQITDVFMQNVRLGTGGGAFPMGLEAMRLALSAELQNTPLEQGGNQGFLRSDSTLGIVFVSNWLECSHPKCEPSDETCIQENDPLFECRDKAHTLAPVDEYFDFLVDEDEGGTNDTLGIRGPEKINVAGIIGLRDVTQQSLCIRTKAGEVRELDVACWPIEPQDKVPPEALGDSGQIYDEDVDSKRAKFTVPASAHTFTAADQGKWVRITGATQQCNNGVWPIVGVEAGENAVWLQRNDDLWEEESGLLWEMGLSTGYAFEGQRYAELVNRFPRGRLASICSYDWEPVLASVSATYAPQFSVCLDGRPDRLEALLALNPYPQQACSAGLGELLAVEVDGEALPCGDADHPWYVGRDEAMCDTGPGYKLQFPVADEDARRRSCNDEPPGAQCFPLPGSRIRVQYVTSTDSSKVCPTMDYFGAE